MTDEFGKRRGDQLAREGAEERFLSAVERLVGPEEVATAFAGVEREQLETELYKVGCALIAAIEEYGVDGELAVSAEAFRRAGGQTIEFALVGGRLYVKVP